MLATQRDTQSKDADHTLKRLLQEAELDEAFHRFAFLTQAPRDMGCILLVARNLHDAFDILPSHWRDEEPFLHWPELVAFLLANKNVIRNQFGARAEPESRFEDGNGHHLIHPLDGWGLERHALYAMLCNSHEVERLRGLYAALQLQILYARWAELRDAGELGPDAQAWTPADPETCDESVRRVRLPYPAARAVRYLSAAEFSELLEFLDPNRAPDEFSKRYIVDRIPSGRGFASHYTVIRSYCERVTMARPGQTRNQGSHCGGSSQGTDYIEYSPCRIGMILVSPSNEEDSEVTQEAILETSISEADALSLGLAPTEMAGGKVLLLSHVPDAKSEGEALQKARSCARRYEIDRMIYPWGSHALRVENFKHCILPWLEKASVDDSMPLDELMAATIVGCVVESGRNLEDALTLNLERLPKSRFVFEPAKSATECGYWNWWAIGPLYKGELSIPPDLEVPRSTYLRYRASTLVSRLVCQYRRRAGVSVGPLFRKSLFDCNNAVNVSLGTCDPQLKLTIGRLSHLRWTCLHEITGGELASACLLLGLERTQARVELFYAVLSEQEATDLFEESGKKLWGDSGASQIQPSATQASDLEKFVGCRAFPRLQVVRDTIQWLQAGSKRFFSLRLSSFDPEIHADLLNRAVMYLVWHQMFAFGTRAICDAYQPTDSISEKTGMGVLSDKDFADGYKTRLIWAPSQLREHMRAVEARLDRLVPINCPESPLWLIDLEKKHVRITPTSIANMLGERFPFPVNTPRKVMRYLLRLNGLSHENAEMYMGHWFFGREPWSPLSSFDYSSYLSLLNTLIPHILHQLGFDWMPPRSVK